jgi:hypothetical protein
MVGEAQRPSLEGQLTLLRRPSGRRLEHLEAAAEDVVDRVGSGRRRQPELVAQALEDPRLLAGPQVEIAAEDEGAIAGPPVGRPRRPQHVRFRQLRPVVGRVQVGDADAGGGADEGHRAALGLAFVDRDLASLGDSAELARHPHQGQVRAALAGGDQVRVLTRQQPPQRPE